MSACKVPPAPWRCTREAGHDGPCAAVAAPFVRSQYGTFEVILCTDQPLERAAAEHLADELADALVADAAGERPHLDKHGRWQSDKYKRCPPDLVPLKVSDPTAQDLLWVYARRRRAVDADFADDLETRLERVGFKLPLATMTRDALGRVVREAWVAWAKTDPRSAARTDWLKPYDDLDEADKEADRRIGEAVERGASVVIAALHNELIKASEAVIKEQKRAEAAESLAESRLRDFEAKAVDAGRYWGLCVEANEQKKAAEKDLDAFKNDVYSAIEGGLGIMTADAPSTIRERGVEMTSHHDEHHEREDKLIATLVDLYRSFGPLDRFGDAQPLDEVNVRQMREDVEEAIGPERAAEVAAEEEWPVYAKKGADL